MVKVSGVALARCFACIVTLVLLCIGVAGPQYEGSVASVHFISTMYELKVKVGDTTKEFKYADMDDGNKIIKGLTFCNDLLQHWKAAFGMGLLAILIFAIATLLSVVGICVHRCMHLLSTLALFLGTGCAACSFAIVEDIRQNDKCDSTLNNSGHNQDMRFGEILMIVAMCLGFITFVANLFPVCAADEDKSLYAPLN